MGESQPVKGRLEALSAIMMADQPAKQLGVKPSPNLLMAFDASGSTVASNAYIDGESVRNQEFKMFLRYLQTEFPGIGKVSIRFFGNNVSVTREFPVMWIGGEARIIFPEQLLHGLDTGATMTALALAGADKFDVLVICTDGNSNNKPKDFEEIAALLLQKNIKVTVLVVSPTVLNLDAMSEDAIYRQPGLELLNMMKGCISTTVITCRNHRDKIAQQIQGSTQAVYRLMDVPFPKTSPLPIVLDKILTSLEEKPFEHSQVSTFDLITGLFFLLGPFDRSILTIPSGNTSRIVERLRKLFPTLTVEEIKAFAVFGAESSGNGLIAGGANAFEVRSRAEQKHLYARVSQSITNKGLIGQVETAVVLPVCGIMILQNSEAFTHSCGTLPSCVDLHGHIGCALYGPHQLVNFEIAQMMRQLARQVLKAIGFPAADSCTEAIVALLLMMQQMLLTGTPLDHQAIQILRMMAQAAWNMTISSLVKKDEQNIIWDLLVKGEMPMKKEGSLMELFSKVTFIPLTPYVNWALLMACLGDQVFQPQKIHFGPALDELEIKASTAKDFLTWFVATFRPYVQGTIPFVDATVQRCPVTYEDIKGSAKQAVYPDGSSPTELLSPEGWAQICQHQGPDFCPLSRSRGVVYLDVMVPDPQAAIVQAMAEKKPFVINLDGITLPCMSGPGKSGPWNWKGLCVGEPPVVAPVARAGGGAAAAPVPFVRPPASSGPRKYVIYMNGQTTPQKTAGRAVLEKMLDQMPTVSKVVLCKATQGLADRAFNGFVQQTVGNAKKTANREGKSFVVIIDVNDDNPLDNTLYGIKWLTAYTPSNFTFWPNADAPDFETTVETFVKTIVAT